MKSVGIWHSITIYSRMIGSVDAQANIKKNEARNMYQETWIKKQETCSIKQETWTNKQEKWIKKHESRNKNWAEGR